METTSGSASWASRVVPLLALGFLALVISVNLVRPRTDETFDGLLILNFPRFEFYPDVKECPARGIAYWIIPNDDLRGQMTLAPEDLAHGAWRVRFKGNLSGIGRYGYLKNYWREVHVVDVYEVTATKCSDFQ